MGTQIPKGDRTRGVLLNGQGDYIHPDQSPDDGLIPSGCFVMFVNDDEFNQLATESARMLADGELVQR